MEIEEFLRSAMEANGVDTTSIDLRARIQEYILDVQSKFLLDAIRADDEEEKYGFNDFSGTELQSVVDEIKSATGRFTS